MLKTTMEQAVKIASAHSFVNSCVLIGEVELEIEYKDGTVEIEIPYHHTPYGFYRMLTKYDESYDQYDDDSFDEKMRNLVDGVIS